MSSEDKLTIRQRYESIEESLLCAQACPSSQSRGRQNYEPKCEIRTDFQRDRDRIIHCKAFRRLKHKTQVFLSPAGDHYRTRLTHTLEVMQVARTISRALRLNEDLTEAIALGHDLGHTPFGHAGEQVLTECMGSEFQHNLQSLRVVDLLENDGEGLNLTWEVRDGIMRHSKGMNMPILEPSESIPATLEGQVVRISDIIAYVNHDLDDAIRAGILRPGSVPKHIAKRLGETIKSRLDSMIRDVIYSSLDSKLDAIKASPGLYEVLVELRSFLYENVYLDDRAKISMVKVEKILRELFEYYSHHPLQIPRYEMYSKPQFKDESLKQIVCDYIAGMSDRYALETYRRLFLPEPWDVF